MDVPAPVQATLGDEQVAAHVALKGDDALYVTATRTLSYGSEGLLSDESVDEYPHDAERVTVSEGRRTAKITLDYGLEGERTLAVPAGTLERALHVVLAGVLRANGVTDADESVLRTYRFSELTLVVSARRIIKQIGEPVWDVDDFEERGFDEVTSMRVEEGSVSSAVVLETTGRPERIKTPNAQLRDVRETVEQALFDFFDVTSHDELEAATGAAESETEAEPDDAVEDGDDEPVATVNFGGEDLDPIETESEDDDAVEMDEPTDGVATDDGVDGTPAEPVAEFEFEEPVADETTSADGPDEAALREQVEALHEQVERQREMLAEQEALLEDLAAELDLSRDR